MSFIKKIELPDNNTYDIKNTIIPVNGTQNIATNTWIGNIDVPSLYDGLTIIYHLPYASEGEVTLNLTLSSGVTTGEIKVYLDKNRLSGQLDEGIDITLTYQSAGSISIDGVSTIDDRWIAQIDTLYDFKAGNKIGYFKVKDNRGKENEISPYYGYGIDNGDLPLVIDSVEGEVDEITINGNDEPNRIDTTEGILPMTVSAYGGNATDWEIYGNNNPVVEDKTGVLPIDVSATAGNLLDYTIYGNDDIGKNIFSTATFTDYSRNNVVMTADKNAGTVSIYSTDTPTATSQVTVYFVPAVTGNYLMSGVPTSAYGGLQIYCWDSGANARAKAWDKTTDSGTNDSSHSSIELYLESGKTYSLNFRVLASYGKHEDPVIVSPMVRLDGTSSDFEPYTVGVSVRTKNLLEIGATSGTVNNVTFTVDKNAGTIVANSSGAASATTTISWQKKFSAGTYIFSAQLNGTDDTYRMDVSKTDWTFVAVNYTGENTITLTEDTTLRFRVVIFSGYTANNIVFKPMLRATNTDAEFVPYGYQVPLDIRHKTKNYAKVETGITTAGVTFTVDPDAGTMTANGTATGVDAQFYVYFNSPTDPNNTTVPPGNYYFSGCPSNGSYESYNCYSWDFNTHARSKRWDGTTNVDTDLGQGSCQVQINGNKQSISMRINKGYTANNVVFKPMLRAADTTSDFEPYYLINQTDIYIGDSPLTQGQSITKAQSGQDVTLFSGDNIIDTTLYNKPTTSITYNSSVLGVGARTKNYVDLSGIKPRTVGNVTLTPDNTTGFVTCTTTGGAAATADCVITNIYLPDGIEGNYYLSGSPNGGNEATTWDVYPWDATTGARPKKWDGVTTARSSVDDTPQEIQFIAGHTYQIGVRVRSGQSVDGLVFKPMIRKADTTSEFVPFGYQIPLSVTSGQTTTPYNYYIGNSPLTAGQSISKTSTGTDIALLSGTNTISTTLGNKPEMKIDYLSAEVGVGEPTENLFDVSKFGNGSTHTSSGDLIFDISNQTVIVNLTSTVTYPQVYVQSANDNYLQLEELETYTISLYKENVPEGSSIYLHLRAKYNGGDERVFDRINDTKTITIPSGWTEWKQLLIVQGNGLTYENCKIRIDIVKGSIAPTAFIPYGYQIPITVSQTGQILDTKNIYIGTSLLTQGDSVTKTKEELNINTYFGENIIDSTVYNPPSISIKHPQEIEPYLNNYINQKISIYNTETIIPQFLERKEIDNHLADTIGTKGSINLFPIDKGVLGDPFVYSQTEGEFYIMQGDSSRDNISSIAFIGLTDSTSETTVTYKAFFNYNYQYSDHSFLFGDLLPGDYVLDYETLEDDFSNVGEIYYEVYETSDSSGGGDLIASGQSVEFTVTKEKPYIMIEIIAKRNSGYNWEDAYLWFIPFLRRKYFENEDVDSYIPSIKKLSDPKSYWLSTPTDSGIVIADSSTGKLKTNNGIIFDGNNHILKIGNNDNYGSIQLQAGSSLLYNTITAGACVQPVTHTLPSTTGTLINNTDYNNSEITIYTSHNNDMTSDNNIPLYNVTNIRDKIKYIDIYFTDNNYYKGFSGGMNIVSENYGYLRIPYDEISKDPINYSTRFSLFLVGDQDTFYLRKRTYYIYEVESLEDPEDENSDMKYQLGLFPSSNNKDLVLKFDGTPGTSPNWNTMTLKGMYSPSIKIYMIKLILEL